MKSPAPRPTPPAATTHLRRAHISGSAPAPCRRIREATNPDTDETDEQMYTTVTALTDTVSRQWPAKQYRMKAVTFEAEPCSSGIEYQVQ